MALDTPPPDHSTLSRTRRLLDLETHEQVFTWVLGVLATAGLVQGETVGVDATTLEANAALRSIVRRADGQSAEPDRGRRDWTDKTSERDAVYANRRRIRGRRGKALLRSRGELLERPFAHALETGAMRRTHLLRHANILKRLVVHVSVLNLGLLMRTRFGVGTPRGLQGRPDLLRQLVALLQRLWAVIVARCARRPRRGIAVGLGGRFAPGGTSRPSAVYHPSPS